jgi:carotenoid cleavage dioxygenase-like enzyme
VGRRAKLLVFERALDDARNGLPSVLLVCGDAGIGKTTIVSEAAVPANVALYPAWATHVGGETDADCGWLVGFVHHASGDETDLVVLDAADITRPAIATVTIPRHIPRRLRSTWITSTHQ